MDGEGTAFILLAASILFLFLTAGLASARRSRPIPRVQRGPAGAGPLIEAAKEKLREKPFDRMTEIEKAQTATLLHRADAFPVPRPTRAEIHLALGEMALLRGDRTAALRHFRMVLVWEPRAGVQRTVEALESQPAAFRERPALRRAA